MPISFTTAPTATVGQPITAAQRNALAAAFNDRFRWNVGDPLWRIWYAAWSIFRKFQTNDGDDAAANDEWFHSYGLVEPSDGVTLPPAPTGSPDGSLNGASPLSQYLFGDEAASFESEDGRAQPVTENIAPFTSNHQIWQQAKHQRGAFDPATQNQGAPAADAAVAYRELLSHVNAIYLRKYGGWMPRTPQERCPAYDDDSDLYLFFPLRAGLPEKAYHACLTASDGFPVGASIALHDTYYQVTYSGGSDTLFYSDYLQLKTGRGTLQFTPGDQMDQILIDYLGRYRGSNAQRSADGYAVASVAADYQKFFGSQYLLAPSKGHTEDENVIADYPQFVIDATDGEIDPAVRGDTFALVNGDSFDDTYEFTSGFVFAGFYLSATGLTTPVTLGLYDDMAILDTLTLQPGHDQYKYYPAARSAPPALKLKLLSVLNAGAIVTLEAAELVKYKPSLEDGVLVMRLSTTRGPDQEVDARGEDEANAPAAINDYFAYGCITNDKTLPIQSDEGIVQNPIYDASRKMIMDHLRMARRDSLLSYTVSDSRAVLRFRRFITVSGVHLDLWRGIAPPTDPVPSGSIQTFVQYKVVGGTGILYNGATVAAGSLFTGAEATNGTAVDTYTKIGGSEVVRQYEGIVPNAPQHGTSNEWFMFMNLSNFSTDPLFAIDSWNDAAIGLFNRCLFNSDQYDEINPNPDINEHVEERLLAFAPTSMNYARGQDGPLNWLSGQSSADRQKFFSSCQVYPESYRLRSAILDNNDTEVVITLEGPLQSSDDFRTDDNALTDYADWLAGGQVGQCPMRVGDQANPGRDETFGAGDAGLGACCVPRFWFAKAITKVYEEREPNTVQEPHDTRCSAEEMRWMAFCLGAMCEGFLDVTPAGPGQEITFTSEGLCKRPTTFTIEKLCLAAFGNRWFGLLPGTGGLPPADVRPDNPKGFGPMPNTILYADQFNRLASAVNLLISAPLDIPIDVETRQTKTIGRRAIDPDGDALDFQPTYDCSMAPGPGFYGAGTAAVYTEIGTPSLEYRRSDQLEDVGIPQFHIDSPLPSAGLGTTTTDWLPGIGQFAANKTTGFSPITDALGSHQLGVEFVEDAVFIVRQYISCDGSDITQYYLCGETTAEIRMANADSLAALPAHIRDLLPTQAALVVLLDYVESWYVGGGETTLDCGPLQGWPLTETITSLTHTDTQCYSIPLTPGMIDGTAPASLSARPLQPSVVALNLSSPNGNFCRWMPGSTVNPRAGENWATITVPLS